MDLLMIEDIVFTQLTARFSQTVLSKYGMTTTTNFATNKYSNTNSKFPFVYVHLLPAVEVGETLEGDTICGGLYTFEIRVTDDKNQERAKKVMQEVVRVMKKLRFSVTSMPEFQDTEETYAQIARFRRTIGANDRF